MEEAEAAARAVYEAPPPRPRSAEEVADLAADMRKNMKRGGDADAAADVNVASKKEKKRARAAEETGGAASPKKKKKAETPPGGEGGGGAAKEKKEKKSPRKKSPRLASLPADVVAAATAAMASDDEGEGDDGDADFTPKKEKTTKWKRGEVKRLEKVAGELEAEMELADEELPLVVSELHEKAKETDAKADIDTANAVSKIYTALKKAMSVEAKETVGLFITKCAEVRAE